MPDRDDTLVGIVTANGGPADGTSNVRATKGGGGKSRPSVRPERHLTAEDDELLRRVEMARLAGSTPKPTNLTRKMAADGWGPKPRSKKPAR